MRVASDHPPLPIVASCPNLLFGRRACRRDGGHLALRAYAVAVLAVASLAVVPALSPGASPAAAWQSLERSAATAPAPIVPAAVGRSEASHGQVFLLRGLINVFSFGMDTLGRKLRAKGIPVRVTNFTNWRGYAAVLLDKYRTDKSLTPVVIMGHSLGADAAIDMGNYLATQGVPIRLIVAFDGVHGGHTVGPGIAEVINYYKSDGVGKLVTAGPGFKGKLTNIDVSDRPNIDHLNIEKSPELHAEVVAKMTGIFAKSD